MTEVNFYLTVYGKILNTFIKRQSPIIFSILKAYKDTKFWAQNGIKKDLNWGL